MVARQMEEGWYVFVLSFIGNVIVNQMVLHASLSYHTDLQSVQIIYHHFRLICIGIYNVHVILIFIKIHIVEV